MDIIFGIGKKNLSGNTNILLRSQNVSASCILFLLTIDFQVCKIWWASWLGVSSMIVSPQ